MKNQIKKVFMLCLAVLSISTVKAVTEHYTTYVKIGYPYKVDGSYRSFAAGNQKIILKDINVYSAETQPINIALFEKGLLKDTEIGSRKTVLKNSTDSNYKISLDFGTAKKSGKRKYTFYNNLSKSEGASVTAVYIGTVEMYPV